MKFSKILILISTILFSLFLLSEFTILYAAPEAPVQEETSAFVKFIKNLFNKMDFVSRLTTTFDSNIFLAEDNDNSDLINTFTQKISLKIPEEKYFLEMDYTGSISYYTEEGDNIYDHSANFLFSYRPFDNFSYGIGNSFKQMHTKKITSAFGDRLLSRGYRENTPVVEIKYEPTDKITLDLASNHYYLDAASTQDDYIDRDDWMYDFAINYDIWPELSGIFGYGYQDNHFPHLSTKDAKSHRGFVGFLRKFKSFNLSAEVGQQHKETYFHGNDANTDFKVNLDTTYSVFTRLNLGLTFNKVNPSSRQEYLQYCDNAVEVGLWHLLNPKTSISTSVSFERQEFDSSDVLSGNAAVDRTTDIISLGANLNRKFNDWLSLDLGYVFSKRNTDFAQEGYTDNRVNVGLTASY